MVTGSQDEIVPPESVTKLVDKLRQQRGIAIGHSVIQGANHFFANELEELDDVVNRYLDDALSQEGGKAVRA
jgi:alpha/beta superfamily hydrolase